MIKKIFTLVIIALLGTIAAGAAVNPAYKVL